MYKFEINKYIQSDCVLLSCMKPEVLNLHCVILSLSSFCKQIWWTLQEIHLQRLLKRNQPDRPGDLSSNIPQTEPQMPSRQVSSDGISETTIDNRTSSSDKGEGIEASKSVTIKLSANQKQESPMVYLSSWDETRKSIVYDKIFYD